VRLGCCGPSPPERDTPPCASCRAEITRRASRRFDAQYAVSVAMRPRHDFEPAVVVAAFDVVNQILSAIWLPCKGPQRRPRFTLEIRRLPRTAMRVVA